MSHATHINESCHTYKWVMQHIWRAWAMSHIWINHVTRHTHGWVMSHTWTSHVTNMNESCHTYERVMSHAWMSHVTHMNDSRRTYEWVISHIWTSHVTHLNESCHTNAFVMSHIWVISYKSNSHVAHMSHVDDAPCAIEPWHALDDMHSIVSHNVSWICQIICHIKQMTETRRKYESCHVAVIWSIHFAHLSRASMVPVCHIALKSLVSHITLQYSRGTLEARPLMCHIKTLRLLMALCATWWDLSVPQTVITTSQMTASRRTHESCWWITSHIWVMLMNKIDDHIDESRRAFEHLSPDSMVPESVNNTSILTPYTAHHYTYTNDTAHRCIHKWTSKNALCPIAYTHTNEVYLCEEVLLLCPIAEPYLDGPIKWHQYGFSWCWL